MKITQKRAVLSILATVCTVLPVAAFASGGLSDYVTHSESTMYVVGQGAMVLMFLVGIVAAMMLVFQLFTMHNHQGEQGRGKRLFLLTLACAFGVGFGGLIDHMLHTVEGPSATTTQSVNKSNFGLQ